jgi:Haem-binding domain
MKSRLKVGIAGVSLLGFVCALVHPFGAVKARHSDATIFAGAETLSSVTEVMERSCQNCHSERTVWPWYSYVPPISWMIENDVYKARKHMNISRWQDYTTEQQVEILSRLGAEVRNHQMPMQRYLSLHPEARLSESDIHQLYEWSRTERRRLRSTNTPSRTVRQISAPRE